MTTRFVRAARSAIGAVFRTSLRTLLVLAALWLVGLQSPLLAAESAARLVQVSGTVAVVRADGSALQPAPADTALGPGDRIATVGKSGAAISIAGVGEITLGADTTVIVRQLRIESGGTVVLVEVVHGITVHRLTAAGGALQYQVVDPTGQAFVDARGAASFGVARDANGNLTAGCDRCPDGSVSFPSAKHGLGSGWARTLTARGDLVTDRLSGGLFDALARGASVGDDGSKTADGNRAPAGQRTSSRDSRRNRNDNDDTPNNTAAAIVVPLPTVQATIASFVFLPDPIVVQVGQSIRWINLDFAEHTVTEDNHLFTSAVLNYGDTYTLTLLQPGTYNYFCEPHPQMTATIIVQ